MSDPRLLRAAAASLARFSARSDVEGADGDNPDFNISGGGDDESMAEYFPDISPLLPPSLLPLIRRLCLPDLKDDPEPRME